MDGVAKEIYELLIGLPEESAKIVAGMIAADGYHATLGDYDFSKAYLEHLSKSAAEMRTSLVRSYVAKRQSGAPVETIAATAQVVEAIHKAGMGFSGETPEERRKAIKGQPRNHGQFGFRGSHKVGAKPNQNFKGVNDVAAILQAGKQSGHGQAFVNAGGPRNAFTPEIRNYERLSSGARLLNAAAGPYLPGTANVALATAGFAGEFGAAAQQTFQPSLDRAKYRYTGVERKLDPKLVTALKADLSGKNEVPGAKREKLIYGHVGASKRPGEKTGEWQPSKTIEYFRNELPSQRLAALQRTAGHFPPSRGIILDAAGRPVAQMHGSGDDWYLPFDLANLQHLKGGEYIRTRTNGGLSTEDVYTGLMAGARSVTVVSHNGVYTMQFDDTLRGSRRYSQSARQMTERYGQLLDAVKNGRLRVDQFSVDPAKANELWEEAGGDPVILQRLKEQEAAHPTPSRELSNQWTRDFLADVADARGYEPVSQTRQGNLYRGANTVADPVDQMLARDVVPKLAAQLATQQNDMVGGAVFHEPDDPEMIAQAQNQLIDNPGLAAGFLDEKRQYNDIMRAHTEDYEKKLAPVTLNGQGYQYAMDALQEQFPYYIDRVHWQPWRENAVGDKDEGYVKPRFVRPAGAQAGYFDETILGTAKVPADRIRFQNYAVMRNMGDKGSYEAGQSGRSRPDQNGTVAPESTPTPQGGDKKAAPTPMAAHSAAEAKRNANLDMIHHLLTQTHFSGTTKLPNAGAVETKNSAVSRHRVWMEGDDEFDSFTHPIEDFANLSDDELDKAAAQMMATQNQYHLFDTDPEIEERWKRGGAPAPAKPAKQWDDTEAFTHDPRSVQNYSFGAEFAPGRTVNQYATTYKTHPLVQRVVTDGGLGPIDDPDTPDRATDYILDIQDELDPKMNDSQVRRLSQRIQGAQMVKQLVRHYAQAKLGAPTSGATFIPIRHGSATQQATRQLPPQMGLSDLGIGTRPIGGHYPGAPTMQQFMNGQLRSKN